MLTFSLGCIGSHGKVITAVDILLILFLNQVCAEDDRALQSHFNVVSKMCGALHFLEILAKLK